MVPLNRPATRDGLFLWIMHQFAEEFDQRAILKGGLALRLQDSHRSTTDIDYVFAPLRSKKEARTMVEQALADLPDAIIDIKTHSKMVRAMVQVDEARVQVEVNVAQNCPAEAMSTADYARSLGRPARVVSVMAPSYALADKLAAWNERRLARDLYDCFFLRTLIDARPDLERLDQRLQKIESRIPSLASRRSMSREEFAAELQRWADRSEDQEIVDELRPLLPPEELPGLARRIKAAVRRIALDL